jgi:hypothetical protein
LEFIPLHFEEQEMDPEDKDKKQNNDTCWGKYGRPAQVGGCLLLILFVSYLATRARA